MHVVRYFFREAWRDKKHVFVSVFFVLTTILLGSYAAPLFIAYILAHIQSGSITLANSWWIIVCYFIIQVFCFVVGQRIALWSMWTTQTRGAEHLYQIAFSKLSEESMAFYSNTFTGSLVSRVNRFATAFISFWNTFIYQFLYIVISMLATLIILAFIIWPYALALGVLTLAFIVLSFFGTRFMRHRYRDRSESYNKISGQLSDTISNILTVKSDARTSYEKTLLKEKTDDMVAKEFRVRNGFVGVTSGYSFVVALMNTATIVAAVLMIQLHIGAAPLIYIALVYTFNLVDQIWNVNGTLRSYYQFVGDAEEMLKIIDTPIDVVDKSTKKLRVTQPAITFNAVSFAYKDVPDDEQPNAVESETVLFSDFSLDIPPRQKVGLVGVSGSGKSTLVRLLLRFMEVGGGEIKIDGQNVANVTQQSLHQQIAYVPQEPLLFHRSLHDNIAYGNLKASQAEIKRAAKQANALEFVEDLPQGFETLVGERGVKLSGGQRQRVAIARAILKDAPILVLDEATSALDSESEKLIQDALSRLMKNRTSIVIAHRLSTIAKLDRIIVLDHGKIVEDGSHAELLKLGGTYAKLWAHQSGGFIEE